ncbi:hypothetical protein Ancab_005400 [Ancistrocladus abbreviatus]
MDLAKKRKTDDNGVELADDEPKQAQPQETLTREDARKVLEPLSQDDLISILQDAVIRHPDILAAVRSFADRDIVHRKLFVRGLGTETTTDSLGALFTSYGDLDEAVVITDKTTGKSKGYGFVTFKHVDGAVLALRKPNKKIDGRMTITHLAAAGGSGPNSEDIAARKIYVGNIPFEISAERLLDYFATYGEIEEGPLGFDKQPGKPKGFAFLVYKKEEGAKASLIEPVKMIDGHQVHCKLATDGKKGKSNTPNVFASGGEVGGGRMGGIGPMSAPGPMNPQQFGGSNSGFGSFGGGYGHAPTPVGYGQPASMPGQAPAVGGYGSSIGGSHGGTQFSGPGSEFSSYRMPQPNPTGVAAPGYTQTGGYPMNASGFATQQQYPPQQPPPQGPPGGIYQRMPMPPYY